MSKGKKAFIICSVLIVCALFIFLSIVFINQHSKKQISKIPSMSPKDCISYTLKDNKEGMFAISLIKGNNISYSMYGENGNPINDLDTSFEIGSITKTIVSSLVEEEIRKGNIKLSDTIDSYLGYKTDNKYPSIEELLTHTSGCKGYYFCFPFMTNFFKGGNPFNGVTKDKILEQGRKLNPKEDSYPWLYSNFGFALLGLVLEETTNTPSPDFINSFLKNHEMYNSYVTQGKSKVKNGWTWDKEDGYLVAGSVVSNIKDMAHYATLQLEENSSFLDCHKKLKTVNASKKMWQDLDINVDSMGMAWVIDEKNGFIWHDGGTSNYNSYLGFCPKTKTAVVVLSNLKPSYRINGTVIGVKLLKELQE